MNMFKIVKLYLLLPYIRLKFHQQSAIYIYFNYIIFLYFCMNFFNMKISTTIYFLFLIGEGEEDTVVGVGRGSIM